MSATDPPVRRAFRSSTDRLVGGVCGGLAAHFGVSSLWLRVGMLVAMLGGVGVLLYLAFWVMLPTDLEFRATAPGLESAARGGRRPLRGVRLVDAGTPLVLTVLAVGFLLLASNLIDVGPIIWPTLLAAAGLGLLWRQADEAERVRFADAARRGPWALVVGGGGLSAYLRLAAGAALLVTAMVLFGVQRLSLAAARDTVILTLVGLAAVLLIFAPWVYRLAVDLTAERAERIRNQERADLAAHLHDSVLQTLAVIQKSASDPDTVSRLARAQERDLRRWLYEDYHGGDQLFAAALRTAAAAVEDTHGVTITVVTVGDAAYDDTLRPLVAAAGEAMANAARHSGAARVDVYAEVSADSVEVFVRDRGVGFSPEAVPEGRLGVRDSIKGRMERHGGTAQISSRPNEGTDVQLVMPRKEMP